MPGVSLLIYVDGARCAGKTHRSRYADAADVRPPTWKVVVRSKDRLRRWSVRISSTGRPTLSARRRSADAIVSGTSRGSVMGERSTKNTPSARPPIASSDN
jgi:hypothetical protein